MKKQIILVSFIAVIAVAISVLYFTDPSRTETYQAAENTTEQNDQKELMSDNTEVAVVTDKVDSTAEPTAAPTPESTEPEKTEPTIIPIPVVTTPTPTPTPAPVSTNEYDNGTYTTSVTYRVPEGGNEGIIVTLTLNDDIVTAVTVIKDATKRESENYQTRFVSAIADYVIGEPIDDLSVSRVGGASLTSRAFNNALEEIKLDAAA